MAQALVPQQSRLLAVLCLRGEFFSLISNHESYAGFKRLPVRLEAGEE